ncbi:MAG: hypothetical protein ACE5FN_06665 [Leptospirillia bacterium]
MIEGTWSVAFIARIGAGADGVDAGDITFADGRATGGDDRYRYDGEYELEGNHLSGNVTVTHYAGDTHTVFGDLTEFEMTLSGTVAPDRFILDGRLEGSTLDDIALQLTRKG